MQHVSVLLLLLVSPWHAESFLPSARPGRSLGGSAELERRARMMCGFSAGEKKKASAAAGAAAARGSPAGASGGRESTWSNPGGKDLVKVSDGVWAAERPFVWNSIDVGKSSASFIRLKVSRQSPRVSCTKKAPAPAGTRAGEQLLLSKHIPEFHDHNHNALNACCCFSAPLDRSCFHCPWCFL